MPSKNPAWDPEPERGAAPAAVERTLDGLVGEILDRRNEPPPMLPLPVDRMTVTGPDGRKRVVDILA
jgi:hypothetical protein